MAIESVTPPNLLILCCPLHLLPSVFPSIRVFSNESVLHIIWPKLGHVHPWRSEQGRERWEVRLGWGWAVNYHLGGPKMMSRGSGIQTQVGAIMFRQERILLITIGGKESWGSSRVIVSSLCGWRWDDLQGVRRLRGDCRCEESGNLFQQGQLSVGEQAPENPCGVLLSFVQKLRSRQRESGWLNMSRTRI